MQERCLYCGKTTEEREAEENAKGKDFSFSREHIFPDSLTGGLQNNPFLIYNVHNYCNNIIGLHVDAPFTKSWFVHSAVFNHAADFVNIEDNPILPLLYFGEIKEINYQGKICDYWHGYGRASIYHFHDPYPKLNNVPPMVGVPPQLKSRKNYDIGFVFLFIGANNPVWFPTIFYSVLKAFNGSVFYFGSGDTPKGGAFSDIPPELAELKEVLFKIGGKEIKSENSLSIFADRRFLAKIALGMCAKFLGEGFVNSPMAEKLRGFMWGITQEDREEFTIHGTSLFGPKENKDELNEFYGWRTGITITLLNLHGSVAMVMNLYATHCAVLKIEKADDDFKDKIGDGIIFIVIPGLKKVVGPLRMMQFLSHKLKMGHTEPGLREAERRYKGIKPRPPFMV